MTFSKHGLRGEQLWTAAGHRLGLQTPQESHLFFVGKPRAPLAAFIKFRLLGNESLCEQAIAEGFLVSSGSISMLGLVLVCGSSCLFFPSLMFSWIQGRVNPPGKAAIVPHALKEPGSSRLSCIDCGRDTSLGIKGKDGRQCPRKLAGEKPKLRLELSSSLGNKSTCPGFRPCLGY